jgi:hypothetical protein
VPSLTSGPARSDQESEREKWAAKLKTWGLSPLAAALLDSAGPFGLLAAQSLYVGEPLLSAWVSPGSLRSLASLLEDRAQSQAFAELLRTPR